MIDINIILDNLWIIVSVFGLIVGSFLNVVILRLNTGMGMNGRSHCFSCGINLAWTDLVPVFSFVFLRGRCRNCKTPISWQYPLVELLTAGLFGLLTYIYVPMDLLSTTFWLVHIIIASIMIVIFVYDARHKIIPNQMVYSFIGLSFILILLKGISLSAVLAGPVLFLPFALLWLLSKGRAIGFGDAKLAWGLGWMLGLIGGASAVILGVWIGALVSIVCIVYVKLLNLVAKSKISSGVLPVRSGLGMMSQVPFAPYLIIGLYIALVTSIDVLNLQSFL